MSSRHSRFLALGLALLTSGCDMGPGFSRTVHVARLPPVAVVGAALRASPGVKTVWEYGLSEGAIDHHFHFSGERRPTAVETLEGSVEMFQHPGGNGTIQFCRVWLGQTVTKAQFDRTLAEFDAIYAELRRRAPELPPPSAVKESRFGYPSR